MAGKSISEMQKEAEDMAQLLSPQAKYDPVQAGIGVAAGIAVVLGIFCTLAGLSEDDFVYPLLAMVAAGFAVPYLSCRSQQDRHAAEYTRQLKAILEREGEKNA